MCNMEVFLVVVMFFVFEELLKINSFVYIQRCSKQRRAEKVGKINETKTGKRNGKLCYIIVEKRRALSQFNYRLSVSR